MSTKTTFKRVALVTVAALGFGMTSAVVPANADQALSFALNTSSITVVGDSATGGAVFAITVTSDTPTVGLSQQETITASVSGVPDGTGGTKKSLASNAADLLFTEVKQSAVTQVNPRWDAVSVDTATGGNAYDGAIGIGNQAHYGMNSNLTAAESETARLLKSRTYYIEVRAKSGISIIDQGVYTIQFDLTNLAGATVQRSTAKVDWVTAAANSGAIITASSAGQWFLGETPTIANQTSTKWMGATLKNRDSGALRTSSGQTPTISATLTDASTSPVTVVMSSSDRGGTLERAFSTTVTTQFPDDGNISVYNSTWLTIAEVDPVLTVRYGLASATATVAIALAATASTVGTASIVGAGQVDATAAATLPLTTKAVAVNYTVKIGTAVQTGYKVYYTLAYGASCVAGDMSPVKATTPTALTTDSLGVASLAITNAYPLDGCTATVTFSGAATNAAAQVVTWSKTKAATALPNPGGSYKAVLKSAQSVTWTILDSFGAIMPGATVTVSHTGANAPTSAPAARASDAKGQVTYTWTDALATATTTDVVSIATVNAVAPTTSAGSITVSYVATLPVVASIKAYYAATTALVGTSPILVPTTVIPGVAATTYRLTSGADQVDITKSVTGASAEHFVALKFQNTDAADAAVTGVPMTVTATNGHILGADGIPTTTRTLYANEAFYVVGTKTGLATYTATTGTNTAKANIMWVNVHTDARVLKATESNGTVTATVTDHTGNVVSGVTVTASLTAGTGRLGNGATYNTYVTASDGTVSFDVTGAATVAVKLSTTTYAKSTFLAGYGDATGTLITTGAPAGVSSVSLTTAGNTVVADSAQTAADAAAEATDAANAATDAANAAAEAADAATAAAQDAADAVAALSAQVATLISGLKAQLTALTNLVIKIQKKVKA